ALGGWRCAIVGGSAFALACNSLVGWRMINRQPRHELPHDVTIYVALGPRVSAADDGGNVAAVVDGLEAKLREAGREVSVVAARPGEPPPVPRVELQIQSTDQGDPAMRGAGQLVGGLGLVGAAAAGVTSAAGSSGVVIDVYAVPASGPVTFSGRVTGTTFGNASDSGNVAGAQAAGESIAARLLR
ncbi:MAG TPA: hypothetical protein VHP33_28585, partial [Polyangiaceae bacterium]|nr:hypothetical protein [Polyangiaceae bacterium]